MEYFVEPGTDEELHQYWIDERTRWYVDLGIAPDNLRHYEHPKEKLSHYSKRTVDIEYRFGFTGQEWGELEGIANRTDFDLTTHSNHSGVDLSFYDQASGTRYRPYVIEPAAGVGRSMMAFLVEAYTEDEAPNAKGGVDKRVVLRLDRRLAPVKAAVLPLSRNADLSPKARDLAAALRKHWNVDFDDAGAIGRRYRRQDEIGTPFCVTVDFDTLDDQAVTDPRARLDGAGAGGAGPGRGLPRRAAARLLSRSGRHPSCRRSGRRTGRRCGYPARRDHRAGLPRWRPARPRPPRRPRRAAPDGLRAAPVGRGRRDDGRGRAGARPARVRDRRGRPAAHRRPGRRHRRRRPAGGLDRHVVPLAIAEATGAPPISASATSPRTTPSTPASPAAAAPPCSPTRCPHRSPPRSAPPSKGAAGRAGRDRRRTLSPRRSAALVLTGPELADVHGSLGARERSTPPPPTPRGTACAAAPPSPSASPPTARTCCSTCGCPCRPCWSSARARSATRSPRRPRCWAGPHGA